MDKWERHESSLQLDIYLHEKLFGELTTGDDIPSYTGNYLSAFMLVQQMNKRGYDFQLHVEREVEPVDIYDRNPVKYSDTPIAKAMFYKKGECWDGIDEAIGDYVPEVIARAAEAALRQEEREEKERRQFEKARDLAKNYGVGRLTSNEPLIQTIPKDNKDIQPKGKLEFIGVNSSTCNTPEYKTYVGLTQSFDYCVHCDKKKEEHE